MYTHIGGDYQVSIADIVAIFDIDQISKDNNKITLEFLENLQRNNILDIVSPEIPRSLIVASDRYYLSPISADTIKERIKLGISNIS